jgi:Protein of unknown function (DUF1524)
VEKVSPSSRLVLISLLLALALVVVASAERDGDTGPGAAVAPTPTASLAAVPPTPTASSAAVPPTPTASPAIGSLATRTPSLPPSAPVPSETALATATDLTVLIAGLPVAAEHRAGYSRDLFRLWIDADGDGCDTRKEVLIADAVVAPTVGSGCRLTGGVWISPYDGIRFTDAGGLDIDHVVPLAEAWDSGADVWSAQQRTDYANDLGVPWALLAVSASSNRSKGDKDPAEWMPPLPEARCGYLVDWVAVKIRWNFTIDPTEHVALQQMAAACSTTPVPSIPRP